MTTVNEQELTKPIFVPGAPIHLPDKLVSVDDSRLCQTVISAFRSMRAEAAKTYKAMLAPLNEKRAVILRWKREDLEDIDSMITTASTKLTEYRERVALEREEAAQAALEKATAVALQERDEEVEFIRGAADMLDDASEAKKMEAEAAKLKDAPPPIIAVFDDEADVEPSLVVQRLTYSGKCVNVMDLAMAVVQGNVPVDALKVNSTWLNSRARADREEFSVPGCTLVTTPSFGRKGGGS